MWEYKLAFKSLKISLSFIAKSEKKELIEDFVYGFFNLFSDIENKTIRCLQKNNQKLKSEIFKHLDDFKGKFPPVFNEIYKFFNKMNEDDFFYFLPGIDLNAENTIKIHNSLLAKTKGLDLAVLNQMYDDTLGRVLKHYDIFPNGDVKKHIGNFAKDERICRFCGRNSNEVMFSSSAHAISNALGNNKVFLWDECDECNKKFSEEIEPDLIDYLSILRTFYDVKGKGGSKKLKGKDFMIHNDGEVVIEFKNDDMRPPKSKHSYNIELDLGKKINTQDIYRCLCKFVISVIDKSLLQYFVETIKWINNEITEVRLPKIAEMISYQHFTKEPKLFVYIRKSNDDTLPFAIGEFHFTCKIISFIIPLTSKNESNFTIEDDYNHYWTFFEHYNKSEGWSFDDFSNDTERNLTFNLLGKVKNTDA